MSGSEGDRDTASANEREDDQDIDEGKDEGLGWSIASLHESETEARSECDSVCGSEWSSEDQTDGPHDNHHTDFQLHINLSANDYEEHGTSLSDSLSSFSLPPPHPVPSAPMYRSLSEPSLPTVSHAGGVLRYNYHSRHAGSGTGCSCDHHFHSHTRSCSGSSGGCDSGRGSSSGSGTLLLLVPRRQRKEQTEIQPAWEGQEERRGAEWAERRDSGGNAVQHSNEAAGCSEIESADPSEWLLSIGMNTVMAIAEGLQAEKEAAEGKSEKGDQERERADCGHDEPNAVAAAAADITDTSSIDRCHDGLKGGAETAFIPAFNPFATCVAPQADETLHPTVACDADDLLLEKTGSSSNVPYCSNTPNCSHSRSTPPLPSPDAADPLSSLLAFLPDINERYAVPLPFPTPIAPHEPFDSTLWELDPLFHPADSAWLLSEIVWLAATGSTQLCFHLQGRGGEHALREEYAQKGEHVQRGEYSQKGERRKAVADLSPRAKEDASVVKGEGRVVRGGGGAKARARKVRWGDEADGGVLANVQEFECR